MEPWVHVYLKHYGLFLLTAILLYFTGRLIRYVLSGLIKVEGFYQKIFFSLSLGTFSLVIIASSAISHFITVSAGFLLIASFLMYEMLRFRNNGPKVFTISSAEGKQPGKKVFFKLSWLILLSLFFFSWQAVTIFKSGNFPFVLPERDHIFYADMSECLWKTGQENTYQAGNFISGEYWGTMPYHYFEMWFGAFFSWLFKTENLLSMQLITIPFFFSMMALGIFSIAETVSVLSAAKKIILFSLLFIGGIPLIADHSSDHFQWVSNIESPLFIEKAAHHYWIGLVGFLFILNRHFTAGFIIFISILFVSGTALPAIAGGGVAFLIISRIFKLQPKHEMLRQGVYFVGSIVFFFLFYAAFGNLYFSFRTINPLLYYTDLSPVLEKGFDLFTLKVMLVELAVRIYNIPFELILVLIPFLLIFLVAGKAKMKIPAGLRLAAVFISCAYFSSLVCYGIFYKMNDSGQFYENIYFFILSFLAVSMALLLNENISPVIKKASAVFLSLVLVFKLSIYGYNRLLIRNILKNTYAEEYLYEISKTNYSGNSIGVFFRQQPGEERITGRNAQILNRMGGYTAFLPQYSTTIDLGLVEMTNWDVAHWGDLEKGIVKTSPFYQYMEKKKNSGEFKSIAQSQVEFIEEFDIGYAIASKNARVSPLIMERVKKIIADPVSGERFMFLK